MVHRYSTLFTFLLLLGGLAWWSERSESAIPHDPYVSSAYAEASPPQIVRRQRLIEVLDRIVASEHYYRSLHGHFTRVLTRLGYVGSRDLTDLYVIGVEELMGDQVLVRAFSEDGGRVIDTVSIDQDFKVRSNFQLPPPRIEFLRNQAMSHLLLIRDAKAGQQVEEQGVFKGYFRYEVQTGPDGNLVPFAVGVRSPVNGLQVELERSPKGIAAGLESEILSDLVQELPKVSRRHVGPDSEFENLSADSHRHETQRKLDALISQSGALEVEAILPEDDRQPSSAR